MMTIEQTRQALVTLRNQFEDAASKYANLTHTLVALLRTEEADGTRLQGPPNLALTVDSSRSIGAICIGTKFLDVCGAKPPQAIEKILGSNTVQWGVPEIVTSSFFSTYGKTKEEAGLSHFNSLADAAWRLALQLPSACWDLLLPPDPTPNLTSRLYVGQYRVLLEREKQLKHQKSLVAHGRNPIETYVPDEDEWIMMGIRASNSEFWLLLLHNIGWRFDLGSPLTALRHVWYGRTSISFEKDESIIGLGRKFDPTFDKHVTVPVDHFYSQLSCNTFLASMWAIDALLQALDEGKRSNGHPIDLIGLTKAATIVADVIGEECSDDTIRRRIQENELRAHVRAGMTMVSEAEVRAKAHQMKKTVGRKKGRRNPAAK